MYRLGKFVIAIILVSLVQLSSSPVSSIQFSATEFWFYVDSPTTIQYPDMVFMIGNNADEDLYLSCAYDRISGINITINLDWYNTTLPAHAKIWNSYSIDVIDFVAITTDISIRCAFSNPSKPDSTISSAGSVVNHIVFYDDTTGSMVDLRIVDQSGSPRNSSIEIRYQPDVDKPYSPIKFVNASSYRGILPNGRYQIFARDIQSGIWGQQVVDIDKNVQITIELALVGFSRFKLISNTFRYRGNNITIIGLNITVNNFVGTLFKVRIYGELFDDNNASISITNIEKRDELIKISGLGMTLWFEPFEWEDISYIVKAYIFSFDQLIAHKGITFTYNANTVNYTQHQYSWVYVIPLIFIVLAIIYRKYHYAT